MNVVDGGGGCSNAGSVADAQRRRGAGWDQDAKSLRRQIRDEDVDEVCGRASDDDGRGWVGNKEGGCVCVTAPQVLCLWQLSTLAEPTLRLKRESVLRQATASL